MAEFPPKVPMILLVNPDLCTGCRLCEMACSFWHYKEFNPARSRITVVKWEEKGLDIPVVCLQCEDAACVAACPTGALWTHEESGLVMYDANLCIGCKTCITACPFGGVGWDARTGTIMKCDWCGGEPQCVRICPTGAVQFVRADASSAAKRMKTAERFSEVVERLLTPRGRL